jgi:dTDP-4-dehydrorhamnose 3,5-epimerase
MRFRDQRGYFTEHFRRSDLWNHDQTSFLKGIEFVQGNESFSRKSTLRGLHFQWNPFMGKMVRTLSGRMIDIVLDIRKDASTFGKAILHEMPADPGAETQEWIWVPPGFAHGNLFLEDTVIEYLCSGEYSPGCEAGISPLAADIDWSLCPPDLKRAFDQMVSDTLIITDKDKDGPSVAAWKNDPRSEEFRDAALS